MMIFTDFRLSVDLRTETSAQGKKGSVLLLTLLIVTLLLPLVLSLVALVRMEMRTLVARHEQMQAQANARLGVNLGIARLQEFMGPDQRITAWGELLDGSVENLARQATILPEAKHRWVGVWDSQSYDETNPASKRFLGWLVSDPDLLRQTQLESVPVSAQDTEAVELLSSAAARAAIHARRVVWEGERHGYAWWVDDHGLKAQLTAGFDNQAMPPPGGGVLPGAFAPEVLAGLGSLAGVGPDRMWKLNSIRDLPFLGAEEQVVPNHYFDFTLLSLGVLADVKNGGLKKDLTLAFENDTVFENVFPSSDPERYLLLDPDKVTLAGELRQNGYIHWNMFKDYYNLKQHIQFEGGLEVLESTFFSKDGLISSVAPLALGIIPPHEMGPSNSLIPSQQRHQPYGRVPVKVGFEWGNPPYRHNPVSLILSSVHQTVWLQHFPSEPRLTARAQLWASFYNPYNIGIRVSGRSSHNSVGIRLLNYPQVFVHLPGLGKVPYDVFPGRAVFPEKRETHAGNRRIVEPGMSQFYGISRETTSHRVIDGGGPFGPDFRNNVIYSVYQDQDLAAPLVGEQDVYISFQLSEQGSPTLAHGSDMDPPQIPPGESQRHDMEVSQIFFTPFPWESHDGVPMKTFHERMLPEEFVNRKFSSGFMLRTTREQPSTRAIRPLVDANIRAPWVNPRWDSPLDLSTPAAYSETDSGDVFGDIPQILPRPTQGVFQDGFQYLGADRTAVRGTSRVVLFDIPREDLLSLGQLQHSSAGRFSYEPSYIVANSYANRRLRTDQWRDQVRDTFSTRKGLSARIASPFNLYDASYLVNQRLWDSFVFTTIPQVRDNATTGELEINYEALYRKEIRLPNPRFIPYAPRGSSFNAAVLRDEGTADRGSFHHNAGHLLVDGAFNVNSTSVSAWEAFLSGTLELPTRRVDELGNITGFTLVGNRRVRYPRVSASLGGGMDTGNPDENYWIGFRTLTRLEVRQIATAMVEQVKRRGPFLNMGEFVNRMLSVDEEGLAGPLQAALDATVNRDLSSNFEASAGQSPDGTTQGAGFPGQLLQGDVLQALSPLMQVRSDTFSVRAYGEYGGVEGSPAAKAWCEVVVQRVPDPVLSAPPPPGPDLLSELAEPSSPFGRQFRVLSFRWLKEEDL